jgi:hypothetical protein
MVIVSFDSRRWWPNRDKRMEKIGEEREENEGIRRRKEQDVS